MAGRFVAIGSARPEDGAENRSLSSSEKSKPTQARMPVLIVERLFSASDGRPESFSATSEAPAPLLQSAEIPNYLENEHTLAANAREVLRSSISESDLSAQAEAAGDDKTML
jgi:hypothetical protein